MAITWEFGSHDECSIHSEATISNFAQTVIPRQKPMQEEIKVNKICGCSIIGSVAGLQIRKASVRFGPPMQINNKPMEYNKNGEVDRYYNLDEILRLNLPEDLKENIKEKFKKKVFYDNNGSCRIGTLIGVERNHKLEETYYIIDVDGSKNFVPMWKSLTRL